MPGRKYKPAGYRYGFQDQEADNEIKGEGNASFFKYRISDNRLGRFWSVDPLSSKYPHNSSYAFSENRLIDGVELEGLEFMNSTTVHSKSFGVAAGIGHGVNFGLTVGTAWDMIGKTQYTAYSAIGPWNQKLEFENKNAKSIFGLEASVDMGTQFAYNKPTFASAMKALGLTFGTVSAKWGAGASVTIPAGKDKVFGLKVGLGIGGTFKAGDQLVIASSISLTDDEAYNNIPTGADWIVDNIQYKPEENGKVGKFSASLKYTNILHPMGEDTGITVFCDAKEVVGKNGKVSIESTNIWKSENYSSAEKKYNKK